LRPLLSQSWRAIQRLRTQGCYRRAEALPASPTAADAAIRLAVKEKVDLDAARAEIKLLKNKLSAGKSQQSAKSSTPEQSRLAKLGMVKNVAKRAFAPKQGVLQVQERRM